MPRRADKGLAATTCACPRSRAKPAAGQKVRTEIAKPPTRRAPEGDRQRESNSKPGLPRLCRPPGPRATCGRELSERPIRSARAGSLGQDMAGRDTGIAPRVLRPIHRSLRSSLSPGADQSGRKPFMIIRVAFAPPTLRRCLARRNPDAKGKDGIFSRAAQPRTRRRALAVYALERRVGLSSPLHTEARARANSCKTPPKNTLKL